MKAADKNPPYHHGNLRRSLVSAALAILSERQQWDFSLREVARLAGVSHNAPYAHFADKQELLAAVAIAGFETLRDTMIAAALDTPDASAALIAIGQAYAAFGRSNPAYYRLMFGPTLTGDDTASSKVTAAAIASRSVLGETIRRGAREGLFSVDAEDEADIATTAITTWALVHGLTSLHIDRLVAAESALELDALVLLVSARYRKGLSIGTGPASKFEIS